MVLTQTWQLMNAILTKGILSVLLAFLWLGSLALPTRAQDIERTFVAQQEDVEAVRQAVLDYVEALYLVDPSRIERGVSPGLAKLGVGEGSEPPSQMTEHRMSYEKLLDLAAHWNKDGSEAAPDAVKEVIIYEVLDYTSSVKLIASWGIDYMHLAKYNGQWMIINVLYQRHPGGGGE